MIVTLQIRTFSYPGMSAVHRYGVLRCPGHKATRLERMLTAEEAEWLNAYDNIPGLYNAGAMTERFQTDDQVRARAQEVWEEKYPDATELREIR